MIKVHKIPGNKWIPNCYFVCNDSDAIIIDPGCHLNLIKEYLTGYKLKGIIATHGHYDHILNVSKLKKEYNVLFYMHPADKKLVKHANFYLKLFNGEDIIEIPEVDVWINDSETLDFEFVKFNVIHTPGHTEGSVCLSFGNYLFTGDLLMKRTIGRTDLPGGNGEKLGNSLKKIINIFPDVNIYPGHGENSTIVDEKKFNTALIKLMNV